MIYINAAIDNKSKYTDSLFTYKAPDCIETGDLVIVPFGKNNSEKTAVVCEIAVKPDCPEEKIKGNSLYKRKRLSDRRNGKNRTVDEAEVWNKIS